MRTVLFLFLLVWVFIVEVKAQQTPFSANVETMWINGNKSGVLAIANQRLQNNPNDIAGLLLTLQYQITFFDVTDFPASANKLISAGSNITTPNFSKIFPGLKSSLQYLQQNTPAYTAQQIQTQAAKGAINGKPMDLLAALQAAELDGLIQ